MMKLILNGCIFNVVVHLVIFAVSGQLNLAATLGWSVAAANAFAALEATK
jgi:hypothetical protein